MEKNLIEICGFKIQAHRKSYLTNKNMECKYSCNGNNTNCPDYVGVEVSRNHFLVYTDGGEIK